MHKNQILVRKISHLTDARYFAAMGVDWMSIELNNDPTSFMRWHTLKDWVSGVKMAAEIILPDEMLIAKTIIDAKPDGIVFHQPDLPEGLPDIQLFFDVVTDTNEELQEGHIRIYPFGSLDREQLLTLDPQTTFIEAEWTITMLDQLLLSGYTGGICFTGGEEDVTGVRDYEMMDELFERLNG
ncbi:MAG TPA: hypothetical protein VGK46_00785 [Saprospiraceae bacterium]